MARALRVRLIDIKQDIDSENHRLELEKKKIDAQRTQLESKHLQLEQQLITLKLQIERADRYGVSHANEMLLTCAPCFVIHNVLLNLMPTESLISGVNLYKCRGCGEEIEKDDAP